MPSKNLPLPSVSYNAPYIEFVLPLTMSDAESMYEGLSSKEIKVYEYILANGEVTSNEIQEHFGIEQKPASRIISKLKEKGYVTSIGSARNTVYKATESRQESRQIV